jgi:hypothetical protein
MRLYLLLVTLVALSLSGCGVKTQGRPVVAPAAPSQLENTASATVLITDRMLQLTIDSSGSPSKAQLEAMSPDLIAALRSYAERFDGVAVVRVANGNHPTLTERPEVFYWGRLDIPPYIEPNLENAPTDIRFFADRRRRYLVEAKDKYERNKEELKRQYYSKVDDQLSKLKLHLLQAPAELAPCTRFSSIAIRIERDAYPFQLFLTDGWADCPDERGRRLAPARITGKLVVLQLARERDNAHSDRDIRQREKFLHDLFPGASVLPGYSVSQAMDLLFK